MIPFLMFKDKNNETFFDLLVKNKRYKSLQLMLNMIIKHEKAAYFYNKHIDNHFIELIGMNLNLSELFKSNILYHQLTNFNTLSDIKEEQFWASDKDKVREITAEELEKKVIENKEEI